MSDKTIIEAITVTAELTQTQLTGAAMATMAMDLLSQFPEPAILQALVRCRRELPGRLTPQTIIDRINQDDGRPSANEAWGIALSAFDEAATVVTNEEINEAMAAARPVMQGGDDIGARMAFRDAYERIVRQNRTKGIRPTWYPSLGTDPHHRTTAIEAAREQGRLTHDQARVYLPAPMTAEDQARGAVISGLLTGATAPMPNDPKFKERVASLLEVLKKDRAA